MLWYSLEKPHQGISNEYPQHFMVKYEKYYVDTPIIWSYGFTYIRVTVVTLKYWDTYPPYHTSKIWKWPVPLPADVFRILPDEWQIV